MDFDVSSLLDLVPAQYASIATAVVQFAVSVIGAFSLLALAIKPLLGTPSPLDPRWKQAAFAFVSVVDFLAANTQKMRDKKVIVAQQQALTSQARALADADAAQERLKANLRSTLGLRK